MFLRLVVVAVLIKLEVMVLLDSLEKVETALRPQLQAPQSPMQAVVEVVVAMSLLAQLMVQAVLAVEATEQRLTV